MGAALTIFVVMSLSVFVIRVASIALRITGLADATARFQALSAFTGTGFTTREAETIVNYPLRRRIISLLMVIGNLGLVSVLATLVVSLVHTAGETQAVVTQLAWLLGGLALLWFLMLNPIADRLLCAWIGRLLESTTILGRRPYHRLLQLGDGLSICEHPVPERRVTKSCAELAAALKALQLTLLTVQSARGDAIDGLADGYNLAADDRLFVYGADSGHDRVDTAV